MGGWWCKVIFVSNTTSVEPILGLVDAVVGVVTIVRCSILSYHGKIGATEYCGLSGFIFSYGFGEKLENGTDF